MAFLFDFDLFPLPYLDSAWAGVQANPQLPILAYAGMAADASGFCRAAGGPWMKQYSSSSDPVDAFRQAALVVSKAIGAAGYPGAEVEAPDAVSWIPCPGGLHMIHARVVQGVVTLQRKILWNGVTLTYDLSVKAARTMLADQA